MCRAVRCRTCGKATWAGCGDHIEAALAGIAAEDRCAGHEPDHAASAEAGFLTRLLGR